MRAFVKKDGTRPVPLHLRNAPTKLMKQLDYGKDYRYAHDEAGGFAAGESYFQDGMDAPAFYRPVERGLEEGMSTRMLIHAGRLMRHGVEPVAACDLALVRPLVDDPDLLRALVSMVDAHF